MQDCRSRRQGLRSVWVIVMYSWARHFPFTMPLSTQECKWVQTGLDFGTVGPHGSSADLCKQLSFNAVHRYPSLVRGKNTFSCIFCIMYFLLSFLPTYFASHPSLTLHASETGIGLYTVGVDFYKQTSCVKLFFSNILQHILPSLTLILYLIFPWHLMLQKLG